MYNKIILSTQSLSEIKKKKGSIIFQFGNIVCIEKVKMGTRNTHPELRKMLEHWESLS